MIAHDFLVLVAYFLLFALIAALAVLENRQMLRHSTTISAFLHQHVFGVFFLSGWVLFGLGLLAGHFMTGAIYCGA